MKNPWAAFLALGLAMLALGGAGAPTSRREQWRPPPPPPPPPGNGWRGPRPHVPPGMTRQEAADLLGISILASQREVQKAYRKHALLTHPDRPGGSDDAFLRVSEARDVMLGRGIPEDTRAGGPTSIVAFHHGGITWKIAPISAMEFSTVAMLNTNMSTEQINRTIQGIANGTTKAYGMGRDTTVSWIIIANQLPGGGWGEPVLLGLGHLGGTPVEEAAEAAAIAYLRTIT